MLYKAIIFDLDQTLIDTSALKYWRDEFAWEECYNHLHLTRTYPYVHSFLDSLTAEKVAVVTNSPNSYAKRLLEYHGIYYDYLVAYQKHGRNKPYPDQLLKCAKELGIEPECCMYIGDDPNDIAAAKVAGFHAIGFCLENWRLEELIPYMPDGIVTDYRQLYTYIQLQSNQSIKLKANDLYEQALLAKRAGNGHTYMEKLKDASDFGHGLAHYRLAKLLGNNPRYVEGDKDPNYFMLESAKQMVPEAIYEIGYQYQIEGNTSVAEKYFRTAANLGLPHAQYYFGMAIINGVGTLDKSKVSYRWLKKAFENGLRKGKGLLEKVGRIVAFETKLKEHLLYEQGSAIFYLGWYRPEGRNNDLFSQEIIKVKEKNQTSILNFIAQLNRFIPEDIAICYVPSSDKNCTDTGIRRIAQNLNTNYAIDATDCLIRHTSKEKSSRGGERSIESHLSTMVIQNRDKIKGNHILLLDDITTSGNAFKASEVLLLKAGALHVTKLALGKTKKQ